MVAATAARNPFTRILPNGKRVNATHTESDFAALLVDPGIAQVGTIKTLPAIGGLAAAVSVGKGASVSP